MADPALIAAAEDFLARAKSFNGDPMARVNLVKQADNLRYLSESPMDTMFRQWDTIHLTAALNVLKSRGAFEAIPSEGSIALQELSKATDTEETIISRAMRIIIVQGIATEISPNVYAHNAKSLIYTIAPPKFFFDILLDQDFALKQFPRYLSTHSRSDLYDLQKSPYAFAHDSEGKTYYEVLSADPTRLNMFNQTLVQMSETLPILGMYPFSSPTLKAQVEADPSRPFIVDIGGGRGAVLHSILQEAPHGYGAPCILQDRPDKMEYDFFTPQPVKNAHLYLLRRILHDFYSDVCTEICKNVASAMGPTSRLLIGDFVVPEKAEMGDDMMVYWMDLSMLMLNGQEKTATQFEELLDKAGLEIVKIWRLPEGAQAVVEAKLKALEVRELLTDKDGTIGQVSYPQVI